MTDREMPERLSTLRETIMLISDPKPGKELKAVVALSVWVNPATNEAVFDMIGTPPNELPRVLKALRTWLEEMPL